MNKGLVERAFEFVLAVLFVMGLALVWNTKVHAAEPQPPECVDPSAAKDGLLARHGGWMLVTPEQWQFLRGVYVLNPNTAAGLPIGDAAALALMPDQSSGIVTFMDGPLACATMTLPKTLLDILYRVGEGEIVHSGKSL